MAKVSLRAYNQEIETMIDRGHLDEAIGHCRHILKTFPKHLETYRLLGKAYLEYKRYPEAADIFSRVLVAMPNDFVANVGMSIIRDEENKLDDAIWHMERAFETQPSNSAIQGELQRLYARREGVAPPRIRMTRGALAHMYVQGELYPQAISEIKSVLKEDPGRNDMQVLLARAYYRSGLKNDAADVASLVLRTNPYNLDANRVLVEILGIDHPESVSTYRQRVVELDPYAAQVTGSIFSSSEVPDPAVTLEHLDWNGQPVGLQPDWQERQAISLESPALRDDQPDWLKNAFGETPLTSAQPGPFEETPGRSVPAFDAAPPPAEPMDEIPDFLREAGWGKSTGAFDESKSAFADAEREPSSLEPIEQGDLPDWVKAMAPQQPAETPEEEEEEELPDWINKIGTSALPVSSEASEQFDWMNPPGESETPAQPAEDQPDWLKQLDTPEQAAASAPHEEPDWLKGFGSESEATPAAPAGELDWLSQLSQPEGAEAKPVESLSDEFDFLAQPSEPFDAAPSSPAAETSDLFGESEAQPEGATAASSVDDFDFLDPLGDQRSTTPSAADEFDFLNELTQQGEQPASSTTSEPSSVGSLGPSEEEQDDAFAWLESLAAKQGATEGLLTKPEERLEEEPDWVKQTKSMDVPQPPAETVQPPVTEPDAPIEELGKSEQEQDDSFAWLESLAAKQGATEGLLTKPEERLEQEPEWVQQAKNVSAQQQAEPEAHTPVEEQPPVVEPSANLQELGTTEQEREDSFAWLESLAAKQGASEGLLTKPEERPEEEPEWVKQAKDVSEPPALTPVEEPAPAIDETEVFLRNLEGRPVAPESEERLAETPEWLQPTDQAPAEETSFAEVVEQEPASADDTAIWLKSLDQETTAPQSPGAVEEKPSWMQEEEEPAAVDDTEAWLKSLDQETIAAAQSQARPDETPEWTAPVEEMPAEQPPTAAPAGEEATPEETVAWLQGLDEKETAPTADVSSRDDTAIWFKSLDEPEEVSEQPAQAMPPEELPAWMQDIEEQKPAEEGVAAPAEASEEIPEATEWMSAIEQESKPVPQEAPRVDTGGLPSWLRGLEEEEAEQALGAQEDLPAWLRDETGEVVAEPSNIERTRATDWHPVELEARQSEVQSEPAAPEPVAPEPVIEQPAPEPVAVEPVQPPSQPEPIDVVSIIEEKITAAEPEKTAPPARTQREPVRKVTGPLTDPVLGHARGELSRNNLSGALENYGRLIKKGRLLEDIIYDLREASYRYPVEVDIWQSLGDAYMRANRLQDALDAYTKAEELLR